MSGQTQGANLTLEAPSTLLSLLSSQHVAGAVGLRLSFHPALVEPITLRGHPYHYCGATGNNLLAVHLYGNGLKVNSSLPIAAFSAGGLNGNTPWRKNLTVSPREAALLAGHAETAKVLDNIEHEVPLIWSRHNHHMFPAAFKAQVKECIQELCKLGWFIALPGAARMELVDLLVTDCCNRTVWGPIPPELRSEPLDSCLDEAAHAVCKELLQQQQQRGQQRGASASPETPLPQYHFRVAAAGPPAEQRRSRLGMLQLLVHGAASAALVALALRPPRRGHSLHKVKVLLGAYLAGVLSSPNGLGFPCSCLLVPAVLAKLISDI